MRSPAFLLALASWATAEAPLTLERCRDLARDSGAAIRMAREELQGSVQTRQATFAKWFPQVSATAGVVRSADPLAGASIPPLDIPILDAATSTPNGGALRTPSTSLESGKVAHVVAATVQQPLFAGGRIANGNRLAALGEAVSRDRLELAQRDAAAQAEDKYWTLLSLQEKRRTLDAYDTLLGALQRQADDATTHGLASRSDRLKVSLQRGEVRVDRLRLESGLRLAARDLRRHLGLPDDTTLALADSLVAPEDPAPLEGSRAGAVDRRLETRLLSRGVRAEELQLSLERGAMLPSVAVGAQVFRAKLDGIDAIHNALVFGVVSVPVSDIWEKGLSSSAQRAQVRKAQVQESDMRRQIALGVEKDWDDLVRAFQAIQVADDAVAQAREALREETDRQANGLSTLTDLLDAQATFQKTLDRRIDARKDYWMARSAYLRSCGGR